MKRKTTTLLLGITAIAALGIAYWQLCSYNEKEEEAALEDAMGEEILNVDTNSLTQVSFSINGQEETFSKKEEAWILERDETFPVDADQILLPAEQLSPLQAVRILENPGELSEYGLDEPQNELTLTDEEGTMTTVTIGDTNSSTGNAYVMLDQDDSLIYTIETTILSYFSDDLYDYAYSDEMPTLQVSEIIGVSTETDKGGYELYLEDAKWAVRDLSQSDEAISTSEAESEATDRSETGNLKAEDVFDEADEQTGRSMSADQDSVNDAMSSLGSLTYADYVEHNCTDDSKYGFDAADTILTIYYQVEAENDQAAEENETEAALEETENAESNETKASTEEETQTETSKEERSVSFHIGSTDSLGNYYVQMVGSAEVHTLSSSVLDNFLGKTMEDWEEELQESESEISETEE